MIELSEEINPLKIMLVFVFCACFFLIQRHYWPDLYWYFPPSLVIMFGAFSLYMIGNAVWWKFRDVGYRVQVGGVSGSINGPPVQVKDPVRSTGGKDFRWDIFALGAVPPFRGKKGVLVVPHHQIYESQGFYQGLTMINRWDLSLLPDVVQNLFDDMPGFFNLDKIYYGEYSKDFVIDDEIGNLKAEIENKNNLISSMKKTIKNKFHHYDEVKSLGERVSGRESWWSSLLKNMKKKKEDEE